MKGRTHAISACVADHCVGNWAVEPYVMDSSGGPTTAAQEINVVGAGGVSILATEDKEDHLSVSEPLDQQLAGDVMDYELWRSKAEADGVITPEESADGVAILHRMAAKASTMVITIGHAKNLFNGSAGIFGPRVIRSWNEVHTGKGSTNPLYAADQAIEDWGDAA